MAKHTLRMRRYQGPEMSAVRNCLRDMLAMMPKTSRDGYDENHRFSQATPIVSPARRAARLTAPEGGATLNSPRKPQPDRPSVYPTFYMCVYPHVYLLVCGTPTISGTN